MHPARTVPKGKSAPRRSGLFSSPPIAGEPSGKQPIHDRSGAIRSRRQVHPKTGELESPPACLENAYWNV